MDFGYVIIRLRHAFGDETQILKYTCFFSVALLLCSSLLLLVENVMTYIMDLIGRTAVMYEAA